MPKYLPLVEKILGKSYLLLSVGGNYIIQMGDLTRYDCFQHETIWKHPHEFELDT